MIDAVLIVSMVTGLGAAALALRLLLLARQSATWPRVAATVTESRVEKRGPNATIAVIGYAYTLGGRQYIGRRVAVGVQPATTGSGAQRLVAQFPAGAAAEIAVRPDQPGYAVLRPGVQLLHVVLVAAPLAWVAGMALVALAG